MESDNGLYDNNSKQGCDWNNEVTRSLNEACSLALKEHNHSIVKSYIRQIKSFIQGGYRQPSYGWGIIV